jgi:6-phosphofructokinase 1
VWLFNLVSALTSGAEMCLIPEIPYNLNKYKASFKKQMKEGRAYFIAVVSEALKSSEQIAEWFKKEIGMESRVMVLGHIQRGGNPTVYDRLMAFHFVTNAIDGLIEGNKNSIVCYNESRFNHKKIEEVVFQKYHINSTLLELGREYGQMR